jgi:hypothetical protein
MRTLCRKLICLLAIFALACAERATAQRLVPASIPSIVATSVAVPGSATPVASVFLVVRQPIDSDAVCAAMRNVEVTSRKTGPKLAPTGYTKCEDGSWHPHKGPVMAKIHHQAFYRCAFSEEPDEFESLRSVFEHCFAKEIALAKRSESDTNDFRRDTKFSSFDLVIDAKAHFFEYRSCRIEKMDSTVTQFGCGTHNGD